MGLKKFFSKICIFVFAGNLYSLASYASCRYVPDVYGTMEIKECVFHTQTDYGAVGRKSTNRSTFRDKVKDLPKEFWGVVLSGKFETIGKIETRPSRLPKRSASNSSADRIYYGKEYEFASEIHTYFKTPDYGFCKKYPTGSKVYVDLFFACCDVSTFALPCGVGTGFFSDTVSGNPIEKYLKK